MDGCPHSLSSSLRSIHHNHCYGNSGHSIQVQPRVHYFMVFKHFMSTFRKLNKMSRIPWFGLWWVTILQYSHIVHTSMTILNCPLLPDNDGNVTAVSKKAILIYTYSFFIFVIEMVCGCQYTLFPRLSSHSYNSCHIFSCILYFFNSTHISLHIWTPSGKTSFK